MDNRTPFSKLSNSWIISLFKVLSVFSLLLLQLFYLALSLWHFAEVADLPAEMWIFWNSYSLLHINSLCLGWTLLSPSACSWGMVILKWNGFFWWWSQSVKLCQVPGERVLGSYAIDDVSANSLVYLPATSEVLFLCALILLFLTTNMVLPHGDLNFHSCRSFHLMIF